MRAAGIEPALLSERDFESSETTLVYRRNQRCKTSLFPDVREGSGNQPIFKPKCVSICVNEGRAKARQELVAASRNAGVVDIAKIFGCRSKGSVVHHFEFASGEVATIAGRRGQRGA